MVDEAKYTVTKEGIRAAGWTLVRAVDEHVREDGNQVDLGENCHWAFVAQHWELVGPALMAKAAGTLGSMLLLMDQRRWTDSAVLLRSLYESVLMFSWVAIDPQTHLRRWFRQHAKSRLNQHDGAVRNLGWELVSGKVELKLLRDVCQLDIKPPPPRESMARAVDAHWLNEQGGLEVWGMASSFTKTYELIYRSGSVAAHADLGSLCGRYVTIENSLARAHGDPEHDDLLGVRMAIDTMCVGLHVCLMSLGWPNLDKVIAALQVL